MELSTLFVHGRAFVCFCDESYAAIYFSCSFAFIYDGLR